VLAAISIAATDVLKLLGKYAPVDQSEAAPMIMNLQTSKPSEETGSDGLTSAGLKRLLKKRQLVIEANSDSLKLDADTIRFLADNDIHKVDHTLIKRLRWLESGQYTTVDREPK